MKRQYLEAELVEPPVAPFAGAWIETLYRSGSSDGSNVAPFAGAWIETALSNQTPAAFIVAPFAGAWIETQEMPQ